MYKQATSVENYFQLFNIDAKFEVDIAALEQTYFALQRQYHPDKYIKASAEEKLQSVKMSVNVNDAYKTLKDDLKRAEYLLQLQGIIVNRDNSTHKPDQALLIFVMEQREQLEEASDGEKLEALEAKSRDEKQEIIVAIQAAFADENWQKAAMLTIKLQYTVKFQNELRLKRIKG